MTMMLKKIHRFELGPEKPNPKRQRAVTIAIAYLLGGIMPLLPYMFIPRARGAMLGSVVVTLVTLLFFGYTKGHYTGERPFLRALQTSFIEAVAVTATFGMAKAIRP